VFFRGPVSAAPGADPSAAAQQEPKVIPDAGIRPGVDAKVGEPTCDKRERRNHSVKKSAKEAGNVGVHGSGWLVCARADNHDRKRKDTSALGHLRSLSQHDHYRGGEVDLARHTDVSTSVPAHWSSLSSFSTSSRSARSDSIA
jgi:hypothetical protein